MPIYDYICKECQHEMEVLQKSDEPDITLCPECGKETLGRQVSAPRFRLGGSGWYETDEKPKDKQRNIANKDDSSKNTEKS